MINQMRYTCMNVSDVSRAVVGGVEVDITVIPNSSAQGTDGGNEWRNRLIVRVRSPPSGGKANREAEEFMRMVTGCRSEVIRGHSSRRKTVKVSGDPVDIIASLEGLI